MSSRHTDSDLDWFREKAAKQAGVTARYADAACELGDRLAAMAREGRGAYLSGPVGAGKTHALMAAARQLAPYSRTRCRVVAFSALVTQARSAWRSNGGDGYDWLLDAARKPVLMLDELGEGRMTEGYAADLYRIVDARYQDGLPLLCASNLALPVLGDALMAGTDETTARRIVSRLAEMCEPIAVDGPDRRLGRRGR